jgi:isopropylmalate/homocitrate/citramalate synthase
MSSRLATITIPLNDTIGVINPNIYSHFAEYLARLSRYSWLNTLIKNRHPNPISTK